MELERYRYANSKISLVLTIYFALKPIYLTSSGSLQIADIFLVLSAIWLVAVKDKMRILFPSGISKFINGMLAIAVFVTLINAIWYTYTLISTQKSDTQYIKSALYCIFNLMAVYVCFRIFCLVGYKRGVWACTEGCFYSTIISLIGILLNAGSQTRNTGFFNNPNQLGFYGVIILTFVCAFGKYFSNKYKMLFTLAVSATAIIMSLSKAAFLSMFIVAVAYVIFGSENKTLSNILLKLFVLILILGCLYIILYSDFDFIKKIPVLYSMRKRVLKMTSENDSDLGIGRGYNRIFEMGNHFIWGMGEGGYKRFKLMPGYEIHSTYANILVSYGIIGSVLFLYVFSLPFRGKNKLRNLACITGIFTYCFTHNGMRNTLFWVLFAIMYLSICVREDEIKLQSEEKTEYVE